MAYFTKRKKKEKRTDKLKNYFLQVLNQVKKLSKYNLTLNSPCISVTVDEVEN